MSAMVKYRGSKSKPKASGARMTLPSRLRENLPFKLLSLLLAGVLYFYVQSERNPIITRPMVVPIVREQQPSGVAVESDQQTLMVNVTGPRSLVDRLKEGELRAVANLRNLRSTEPSTPTVRLTYLINGQPPDPQIMIDPPSPALKLRVYPPRTNTLPVTALFPQEPAAGYAYDQAVVTPKSLEISGRADQVDRVVRLVASASPLEPGGRIDGDFSVSARDTEGNTVESVTLSRDNVHVTVPLKPKPPTKHVLVSPKVTRLPTPPLQIETITVTPSQLRVIGRPERLNQISTVETEPITVQDTAGTQEMEIPLALPLDVIVRDREDRPISKVQVRITVKKVETPAAPPVSPNGATSPTSDGSERRTPD